jgi:hypothetical protein
MSQKLHVAFQNHAAGAFLGLAVFTCPTFAQSIANPATKASDTTITVTGNKADKAEIRSEARAFVGKAIVPEFGQFARRNSPLCPTVIGIDKNYADIVVAKIRATAQNSGVKLAETNCRPNVHVLFVNDSNGFMTKFGRAAPGVFSQVPAPELKALRTNLVPVRWWYSTELQGSDGAKTRLIKQPDRNSYLSLKSFSASLINSKIVIDLLGTIVVVDIEKATGYPLASIAAYAAMVSLVQIKNGKDFGEASSILTMFGPNQTAANAPTDLTRWDYAFVSSLYEIPANRPGNVQKSQLATKMAVKLSQ